MSEHARYVGDLDGEGQVVDFIIGVGDGVRGQCLEVLRRSQGVKLVDGTGEAQCLIIKTKTGLGTKSDIQERASHAMYVVCSTVGTDHIDLKAPFPYINTPDAASEAVAQRAWGMIQNFLQGIGSGTADMKSRAHRAQNPDGQSPGFEKATPVAPSDVVLGIIGYGRIGSELARIAATNRTPGRILCTDTDEDATAVTRRVLPNEQLAEACDIDSLLRESTVISLHVPGSVDGQPNVVLTRERLEMIRPGTLIMNTARARVIDLDALREALDRGVLYAADVHPVELERGGTWDQTYARIIGHPNCIAATPHSASNDQDTQDQHVAEAARHALAAAKTGMLPGALNLSSQPGRLTERESAGYRLVYTHGNEVGVINRITDVFRKHGLNIQSSTNASGPYFAMTTFDLNGEDRLRVLQAHQEIMTLPFIHAGRVLVYEKKATVERQQLVHV